MPFDIPKFRLLNQQLIHPQFMSAHDVVEWMGMVQAQDLEMGLWAVGIRMQRPSRKTIVAALDQGEIVRMHLARCTWQLAAREDVRWMVELHRDRNVRGFLGWAKQNGRPISDEMISDSNALLQNVLSGTNGMTFAELQPQYEALGITNDHVVRNLIGLGEVTGIICNGVTRGRERTYALLDERVPQSSLPSKEEALAKYTHQYFRSHAPATLDDFVWWSGLTKTECRLGIEMLGDALTACNGYFLLRDHREGRMPARFAALLPPFDELLIGYKSRYWTIAKEHQHKAFNNIGIFYPVVLNGKRITGNWSRKELTCTFFSDSPDEAAIENVIQRYKTFLGKSL